MSEVLFGQGYFLRFDPKLYAAARPYPPLGTLWAAAVVREGGYRVALFDAMLAASEQEWADALDRERPAYAVVYEDSFNYLSKMCLGRMRQATLRMLGMARERGCRTAVCGSDATDQPEIYLAGGADAVVRGEGERTLKELLDAWSGRSCDDWRDVPGVTFRGAGGAAAHSPPRPVLRDLDRLPFPAWDLVDVDRYRRIWRARHGYHSMNLATTRGCPYHCNWCAKPIWGQRYNVRSAENVADELALLRQRYRPDHIAFADDIFGLQPGWIERFAAQVGGRGLATPFQCLTRVDLLDAGVVAALRSAGCRMVWVGAESGSQRILDAMEKGTRVEQIHAAARLLRAAGIGVGFFLQFGYPGEARDDIEQTLRMLRECRPDDIGISVSYPLPGTPFYERVKAQLGAQRHWRDSDDLAMMYRGPYSTAFYRALHGVVHKEFRVRRLREGPRRRLRQSAALLYHAATLPLARRRLARLERRPHAGAAPLAPELSPQEAARPSEQGA